MSAYQNFTAIELATNESFRRWVLDSNAGDAEVWNSWLARHPERWEVAEQAIQLLLECHEYFDSISDAEIEHELLRMEIVVADTETRSRWKRLSGLVKVAAAVALIISSLFLMKYNFRAQETAEVGVEEKTTIIQSGETPLPVYLPDGSIAILQAGSRLVYGPGFGDSLRVVRLTGEAFFEVKRDIERPFLVYTGTLRTKVLGTSFNVSAFENSKDVVVSVKTGRVAVAPLRKDTGREAISAEDGMVLTANQEMIYRAEESRLIRRLVEEPELLVVPPAEGNTGKMFSFRNTPVGEVFRVLSEAYGVDIIFEKEDLKNCFLTAVLDDEPLFESLDLICRTIGGRFEQADGLIIINSTGCR